MVVCIFNVPQAAEHYERKVDEEQRAFLQDKIR